LAKGAQEHDIDSAQSREHKRWMIKENMKGVKNMKKKEIQRVAKLVDMAIARDPRLKRAATAAKEKKDAAKNARKAALEKEKNDRLAAAAAAEARANARAAEEAAAAKNLKAAREAKKKAIRRLRSTLRKLAVQGAAVIAKSTASPLPQTISEADVDLICEHAAAQEGDEGPAGSTDDIGSLSGIAALEALQAVFGELQRGEGGSVAARAEDDLLRGCAALARRLSVAQGESSDEAAAAAAAREANHAKAAAEAEATAVAAKLAKDVEWTADEMSMLAKAAKKYPGGGAGRWLAIANYINQQLKLKVPKTKENCLAKYQRIQQNLTRGAGAAVKATGGASSGASVETGRGSAAGSGGAEALQDPDAAPWSALQQRQLETALGKFPSSMDKNERWKAIAATVDGKNKKDCIVRFKFLREQVKLRKGNT
jgi:DnaJ family protein C protein 2